MSRIGRMPVPLPSGVAAKLQDHQLTVEGPKGKLSRHLPEEMTIQIGDGQISVQRPSDQRQHRALHGLTRALVANMVHGVTAGFQKTLDLHGVGYRAQLQNDRLVLQVGFSHPIEVVPPAGIKMELETFTPTLENQYLSARILVSGIDKEVVGLICAKIRAQRKPEPYKGKGIRYRGEVVRRKAGKTAGAGGAR